MLTEKMRKIGEGGREKGEVSECLWQEGDVKWKVKERDEDGRRASFYSNDGEAAILDVEEVCVQECTRNGHGVLGNSGRCDRWRWPVHGGSNREHRSAEGGTGARERPGVAAIESMVRATIHQRRRLHCGERTQTHLWVDDTRQGGEGRRLGRRPRSFAADAGLLRRPVALLESRSTALRLL